MPRATQCVTPPSGTTPGRRLRWIREAAGLTQAEFARLAGVSQPTTVSRWECDRTMPQMSQIRTIATALLLSPSQLRSYLESADPFDLPERLACQEPRPQIDVVPEGIRRVLSRSPDRDRLVHTGEAVLGPSSRFTVRDRRMEPGFRLGDVVTVGKSCKPAETHPGQAVVAVEDAGRMYLGYAYLMADQLELRPARHEHRTYVFRVDKPPRLFPVLELRRVFQT